MMTYRHTTGRKPSILHSFLAAAHLSFYDPMGSTFESVIEPSFDAQNSGRVK